MGDFDRASNSLHLLNLVGEVLIESGIRWGAIGALAVAYHGWVRASMDADAVITLRDSGTDTDKLLVRLRGKGWAVEYREGDDSDPLGFVFRIKDDGGNQVDLIGGIRRMDPALFDRVIETDLQGIRLRIASAEDLVALKVFAGGPNDLEDAAGILDVLGQSLDRAFILELCKRFGPESEALCRKLLLPAR